MEEGGCEGVGFEMVYGNEGFVVYDAECFCGGGSDEESAGKAGSCGGGEGGDLF